MSIWRLSSNKVKAWIASWRSRPNFQQTVLTLAARAVSNYPNMKYEHVSFFFLSGKFELIHEINRISLLPNYCYISSQEITRIAAKMDAAHVVIFHVHPNGVLEFSDEDETEKCNIENSLRIIDCELSFLLLGFNDNKFQVLMPDGTIEAF